MYEVSLKPTIYQQQLAWSLSQGDVFSYLGRQGFMAVPVKLTFCQDGTIRSVSKNSSS